jgi:hypothetical protein
VRQIDVLSVAAERELKNAHAGKTKIVSQIFHVRSDYTEVLGDNGKLTQRLSDRSEQFASRRCDPTSPLRGFVATWNFPTSGEPTEVIDARDVQSLQRSPNAFDPPFETIGPHLVPIEKRVPPILASLAEVIGRHPGHDDRRAIGVQLELLRMRPNVCRVMRDKNRNVANDFYATLVAVLFQL